MVGLPGRIWCQVQTLLCVRMDASLRLRGESLGRSILGCGRLGARGYICAYTVAAGGGGDGGGVVGARLLDA